MRAAQSNELAFREEIAAKRRAEAHGQWDVAAKREKQIVALGKRDRPKRTDST
jgi:hypothetical protein